MFVQHKGSKTMETNDKRQTLQLLKSGNESAFDEIYRRYYRALCAFASQYVTKNEYEEIIQDVMLWLWENRALLIPEMSLKSLLFTIVKNKCLNRISHEQVRQEVHEKLYAKFQEQFENPDFYLGELMALASKAIRELPDEFRIAFELNRFDGLTYQEIAKKEGVSPQTIAYRISQSLKILRVQLKDYLPLLGWLIY